MDSDKIIFGLIGGITITALLFIVFSSSPVTTTSDLVANELIGSNPNQKGSEDAKVTIVEFSDFECPFCAQYSNVLSNLIEKYPNDLRIIYRHFPIPGHIGALPAARSSEAAALQGKFWEYHNELFINQPYYTNEDLFKYVNIVGLDVEKFKQDVSSTEVISKVQTDLDYAKKIGVNATPTVYLVHNDTIEKINLGVDDINEKVANILGTPIELEPIPAEVKAPVDEN